MSDSASPIARLKAERSRGWFPTRSAVVLVVSGLVALIALTSEHSGSSGARRLDNLLRFLREDALPAPLRDGQGVGALADWLGAWWTDGAGSAALATFAIACVAMLMASALGVALSLLGSRELTRRAPFADAPAPRRFHPTSLAVRSVALLSRATPEYVLAYLLLALFGASAWPAVGALALHNAGILGRLGGEVIEDLERRPLRALTLAGTRRDALVAAGVIPAAFARYLLYVLYRFETCLREATVLGMIGIASLGAAVQESRARQRYDELVALLALAGLMVLAVDLISRRVRRWLRAR